jgi:hypothetical protein
MKILLKLTILYKINLSILYLIRSETNNHLLHLKSVFIVFSVEWYIILIKLILSPIVSTFSADKYQVHSILSGMSKGDSFCVSTLLTKSVLVSWKSWVFDAFTVNMESLRHFSNLTFVNTIISFISCLCLFKVTTNSAVIDQSTWTTILINSLFLWIEHIIAFFTETHSFESHVWFSRVKLKLIMIINYKSLNFILVFKNDRVKEKREWEFGKT